MRKREGKYLVDTSSGEIVGFAKVDRFIKSMQEVWRMANRMNLFTASEERTLHRLSMFLQQNTNALTTHHGEYMNLEDMSAETGIDRSNIRKYVKALMRKNAIGRWTSSEREIYYINPFLFQNGEIQPYLFNLFDDEYHERLRQQEIDRFWAGKKPTSLIKQVNI